MDDTTANLLQLILLLAGGLIGVITTLNSRKGNVRFGVVLTVLLIGTSVVWFVSGKKALPAGQITLWYVYGPGSKEANALQTAIDTVEQYSDITIETVHISFEEIQSKYRAAVDSGQGPDLFLAPNDDLGPMARQHYILALDGYVEGRLDRVSSLAINGMKVDGQLYGIPESSKMLVLFYNQNVVSVPPATTEELRQLVQGGQLLAAPISAYDLFAFSGAFGGSLLDASNTCIADQAGWVEMLHYLLDLQKNGALFVSDRGYMDGLFQSGQVAMVINGPWALVDYRQFFGDRLGIAVIPAGPAGAANPLLGVDGFYVNPNTARPEVAVEAALLLTNQQSSQIFTNLGGHIPIRADVNPNDLLIDHFRQAQITSFVRPQSVEFSNYWVPFHDMFVDVLHSVVSPEEGVRRACQAMNQANGK